MTCDPLLGMYPTETVKDINQNTATKNAMAVFFLTAPVWTQPNAQQSGGR